MGYDEWRQEREKWEPAPPHAMLRRRLNWESNHKFDYGGRRDASDACQIYYSLPIWPADIGTSGRLEVMHPKFRDLMSSYDATHGVLLIGPTGAGKTTGAVHAVCGLIERALVSGRSWPGTKFVKATDLALARRRTPLGEDEAELVNECISAHLLVLDDLGQEHTGTDTAIADVLDRRYDKMRPSIVTSGLTLEQLTERYGEYLVRRVIETRDKTKGKILSAFPPALSVAGGTRK